MGTGKTTVAQTIARITGLRFVDADDAIVTFVGKSIPDIFASEGESGFRAYERQVCEQLAQGRDQVIATGGGALIDPYNLSMMQNTGLVVCLTATPDVIVQRLGDMDGRPLAPDWERLLRQRELFYARISHQIDTSHKTPDQIAEEVLQLWRSSA